MPILLRRIIEESYLLYEGLSITHEIHGSINQLIRRWSLDGKITYHKENEYIKMVLHDPIDKDDFNTILKWINNMGYFPTHITSFKSSKKYTYDNAIKLLGKHFAIYFDAKFDIERSDENIPNIVYHITPSKHEEKILNIGLVPKSQNKLSTHPERIYMADTINGAKDLLKSKVFVKDDKEFTIFELNMKDLNKVRKIKFLQDPTYNAGMYTYANIPPLFIKVAERISI